MCSFCFYQRAYLREVCEHLNIPGSTPKRFVQHRWLSAYDVGISTQTMLPAYKVLYFGFMDKEDKALYKEPLEQLYADHSVNEKAQRRIQSFHSDLSGKGNSIHCNCKLTGIQGWTNEWKHPLCVKWCVKVGLNVLYLICALTILCTGVPNNLVNECILIL